MATQVVTQITLQQYVALDSTPVKASKYPKYTVTLGYSVSNVTAAELSASIAAAAASATAAKTSETNAATSKNAAASSATAAKTSETNAKTSETNAKASADAAAAVAASSLPSNGTPPSSITDINMMGVNNTDKTYLGIWNFSGGAQYNLTNVPQAQAGMLEVFNSGAFGVIQRYTTRYGIIFVRSGTATWSAASPNSWGDWTQVGNASIPGYITTDLNAVITPGRFSITAAATNNPIGVTGVLDVIRRESGDLVQIFYSTTTGVTTSNRVGIRSSTANGASWTTWKELFTTQSIIPVANGGTGSATAADARDALGVTGTSDLQSTFGIGTNSASVGNLDWQQYAFQSGQSLALNTNIDVNRPTGFPNLPTGTAYGMYVYVLGKSGTTIHCLLTLTTSNNSIWGIWTITLTGAAGSRVANSRSIATLETMAQNLGFGGDNTVTQSALDFQQFDFVTGATYTISSSTWTNAPTEVVYAAGTGIMIHVDGVTSSATRIMLTLIPNTGVNNNYNVYQLLGVGAKGSRVWSVRKIYTSTDIVATANGGTGNANGTIDQLTTARTFIANLASTAAGSFNGTANVTLGVTGILPIANGGTGNANGTVGQLTTARTFIANLSALTAGSFNGTANITLGVTGTLGVGNGGTGSTSTDGSGAYNIRAIPIRPRPSEVGVTDIDSMGPTATYIGFWNLSNADNYGLPNVPEARPGTLEVMPTGYFNGTQVYTTRDGMVHQRSLSAGWNGTNGPWTEWMPVGFGIYYARLDSGDLNTMTSPGKWSVAGTLSNLPVAQPGVVTVTRRSITQLTDLYQEFITIGTNATLTNRTFTRTLSGSTWSVWSENVTDTNLADKVVTPYVTNYGLGSTAVPTLTDLNSPPGTGFFKYATSATNIPLSGASGHVIHNQYSTAYASQIATTVQTTTASLYNRTFTRTMNSGTWGPWKELFTLADTLPIANGGTGNTNGTVAQLTTARTFIANLASTTAASFNGAANISLGVTGTLPIGNGGTGGTTAAAARSNLGLGNLSTIGFTHSQVNSDSARLMHYDDTGLMILTRRFSVTVAANSSAAWSWNWSSELSVQFTSYPGISTNGMQNNSGFIVVGTESVTSQKAEGFIFNNTSATVTSWVTVTVIGTKA